MARVRFFMDKKACEKKRCVLHSTCVNVNPKRQRKKYKMAETRRTLEREREREE